MYHRPYVESSAFIAFIKGEFKEDNHDCKKIVDSILQAAQAKDFRIFTSSLTIAEVFKNKKNPPLSDQENEDLKPYFREDYIRIIEVDREIGERANELCRTHKPGPNTPALRPNDAIHIACAERANCEVLLAYDSDLTKQKHDSISIEWPRDCSLVTTPKQAALDEPAKQTLLALNAPADEVTGEISPWIEAAISEVINTPNGDPLAQLKADGEAINIAEIKDGENEI